MRKLLLFALTCALLLSLWSLSISAVLPADWPYTPGCYADESGDNFSPVGDVRIHWAPDAAARVDMTDGDIADWAALGMTPVSITENQMVSWIGGAEGVLDPGMPADWGVEAYFMADADYLYMIFDITDSNFAYGQSNGHYDGDALQLSVDFGGRLEEMLQNDPDALSVLKGIFYSFSCEEDGAPIRIMRQESDQDGWISEANGDGVKGATRRTEKGWSAEIALSWQQLYDDYSWKAWDDSQIYVGGDAYLPLEVNMALCYINRTETAGKITWAASTTRGETVGGVPVLTWMAVDNGIHLELPIEEDVSINCTGVRHLCVYPALPPEVACTEPAWETQPFEEFVTEVPEIEYPISPMPPVSYETEVATDVLYAPDVDTDEGDVNELDAIMQKYGCSAAVGTGTLSALLLMAAWALVCKKKD